MADENTSVGKISLDIDLSQDLEKEIGNAANRITEGLQGGVEKGFNLNNIMKSLTDNINNTIKTTMDSVKSTIESSLKTSSDNITSSINSIKEQAMGAISTISESLKNIKVPQQTFTPATNTTAPQGIFSESPAQPRAPTNTTNTPKVNTADFERVRTQIEGLTQQLDITNNRIDQQKTKLVGLKEAYERAFNETRKSKLEEQILTTEQRINSLTRTSDKLGFKLSDLDSQLTTMGSSAKVAGNGVNDLNNKLTKTSTKLKETESSTKKSSSMFDKLGLSFGQVGRMMDRMLLRMVIFNTVINGLSKLGSFMGNALMTNSAFSNSLAQVKSNLEVAFMPIYQAILPALTSLMNALARVTTYFATFIATLFGTTYQASAVAATGLNTNIAKYQQLQKENEKWGDTAEKAAKKVKNSLGGFDEINVLSSVKDTDTTGAGASLPSVNAPMPIVAPPIDTKGIESFSEKVKAILANIKKQFTSISFAPLIKAFGELKVAALPIIGTVSDGLLWFLKEILVPLSKWTIEDLLPAFFKVLAKVLEVLNPIASAFITTSKDLWNTFLKPIAQWTGGVIVDVLNGLAKVLGSIGDWMKNHKVVMETMATVVESFAIAWGLVNLAIGIWNVIGIIATAVTTGFGVAVAFLTSPIFLVTLAIAAVIAVVILLVKHWDMVEKAAKKAWDGIVAVWNAVATWFNTNVVSPLVNFFKGLWDGIVSIFSNTKKWFSDIFTGAWEGIKLAFSSVGSFFGGLWDIIKEKFTTIGSAIGNAIGGAFKTVVNSIIGFAENTINGFIRAINGAIKLINNIPGVNIGLINTLSVPKLAKGGIVDGATPFIAGEAGKEAVMPLENNTGWINQLAGRIGSLIPSIQQPQLAFAPSGNVQATTQNAVQQRATSSISSSKDNTAEMVKLLQVIIDILKHLNMDFNLNGTKLGKVIINLINEANRQAGKNLLIT